MEAEVPSDPGDLAGYAGRLVGLHERRPEIIRICTWQRLERSHGEPSPLGVAFARSQVKVIAEAQEAGRLPAHFAPGFLLGLVLHIATGWAVVSPEYAAAIDVPDPAERICHVENAVRALLAGSSRGPEHACGDLQSLSDAGWREVADTALAFVQRFAPAQPASS